MSEGIFPPRRRMGHPLVAGRLSVAGRRRLPVDGLGTAVDRPRTVSNSTEAVIDRAEIAIGRVGVLRR